MVRVRVPVRNAVGATSILNRGQFSSYCTVQWKQEEELRRKERQYNENDARNKRRQLTADGRKR